jgi:hypothetical protein
MARHPRRPIRAEAISFWRTTSSHIKREEDVGGHVLAWSAPGAMRE